MRAKEFTINVPITISINGDDEPVVFATGPNECSIRLNPTTDANISFNNNGKEFKLFAREIV